MDLLPSVDQLRDYLVAHDRAVREIIALDHYIEQLSNQTFLSNMGEYTTPALQKIIRIAVAEGLKRMYKEYRLSKWLKVQEMAMTVRRVLDGGLQPQVGPMVPYGHQPAAPAPWQQQNMSWQMAAPEAYQWQPAMYQIQTSPDSIIRLVSPINSPSTGNQTISRQLPALPDPYEAAITRVENPSARRDLFQNSEVAVNSDNTDPQIMLDCAIMNVSGLSDSSDEVLDSVNVVNPHGHTHHQYHHHHQQQQQQQQSPATTNHLSLPRASSPEEPQPPAMLAIGYPPSYSQQDHESAMNPRMPQFQQYDNEPLSDLDDSMDWDSDYLGSSYNESEESLAGVLFATEHLLPEEQAVRLDVEMGDMGVGHVLFDRISATWYKTHMEFYRAC